MHGNNDVANSGKSGSRTFAFLIFFKKQDIIVFRFKNHKMFFFQSYIQTQNLQNLVQCILFTIFLCCICVRDFKVFRKLIRLKVNHWILKIRKSITLLKNQRYHNSKMVLKLLKGQRKWFQVFIRLLHTL